VISTFCLRVQINVDHWSRVLCIDTI